MKPLGCEQFYFDKLELFGFSNVHVGDGRSLLHRLFQLWRFYHGQYVTLVQLLLYIINYVLRNIINFFFFNFVIKKYSVNCTTTLYCRATNSIRLVLVFVLFGRQKQGRSENQIQAWISKFFQAIHLLSIKSQNKKINILNNS